MQRIKHGRVTRTKFLKDKLPTDPETCAFCGKTLGGYSIYTFLSVDGKTAQCSHCASKHGLTWRLGLLDTVYKQAYAKGVQPDWSSLKVELHKATAGEMGSVKEKRICSAVALALLQRSASLMAGWTTVGKTVDPLTGTRLAAPRIALCGKNSSELYPTLARACAVGGIVVAQATADEVGDGEALHRLRLKSNNCQHLEEHGAIFVRDGFVDEDELACSVVYAVGENPSLPEQVLKLSTDGSDPCELS